MSVASKLNTLAERWKGAAPAERANAQTYLNELCATLEVEPPRPAGSAYEFEYPVRVVNRDGTETVNFIGLYKRDHFVLEAKHQNENRPDSQLLHGAYGQARTYAAAVDGGLPPYLLVLDVGKLMLVWDRWGGAYGGFQAARRIDLQKIAERPDDIALLQDIFERPHVRDPRGRAAAVTREIAEQLAKLAASLEESGHDSEQVARFLMRCVFTMFAEDVGLLQDRPFTTAIEEIGFKDSEEFGVALAHLWQAMDRGERFGLRKFLRFNGHFFRDTTVLPLTRADLATLHEAAAADWGDVEPSIMGTLLTRALDRQERHRLGAEFTPREYVERVVRPTVEEPIRERWTAVQAEVLQLRDPAGKATRTRREHEKLALERLRAFHEWLQSLRFLDPACGSGNFLYVTLSIVKQVELEVLRTIEEIKQPELAVEEVGPWQFYGLEVKAWAREIAELTLWIGYHQWWRRTHGHTLPPEPVLRDTGTLEHRDAVLLWDEKVHISEKDRRDPTPRLRNPVTGELVPDPNARLPYIEHTNPRQTAWPQAHFIVGNPPYMGSRRMRLAFGDGYVDALRTAYPKIPASSDYVMTWWDRAATEVAEGRAIRAGLITTNSIVQKSNRVLIAGAAERGAVVPWAIPDHPWVDETGSAAVRVAMTVIGRPSTSPARLIVVDRQGRVTGERIVENLNSDLSAHADVARASLQPLKSNRGLARRGVILRGDGFEVSREEGEALLAMDSRYAEVVRPWMSGTDVVNRDRHHFVIDFDEMTPEQVKAYPVPLQIARDRVMPERAGKNEKHAREVWWQFWNPRPDLRAAIAGSTRYIVTGYVSKHRFFQFASVSIVPDDNLVVIALSDSVVLGVLSSDVHVAWADAAGGRMGVGNDPRYNSQCFTSFPFPVPDEESCAEIARLAEELLRHRAGALQRDPNLTTTELYNVVVKLRAQVALTESERRINEVGACGGLLDLHDRLNNAVASAYGWTWPLTRVEILERLVSLHDERLEEETVGKVRWLRPHYQRDVSSTEEPAELALVDQAPEATEPEHPPRWPGSTLEQISALQSVLSRGACTVDEAAHQFAGARRDIIARHLETLMLMGEAHVGPDGAYHSVQAAA